MPTPSPTATPAPAVQIEDANPKRVTDDDLYRHSSQYRLWSFTSEQLEAKRQALNAEAANVVNKRLQNIIAQHKDLSQDELDAIYEKAVPVDKEEELKFVSFFARKVQSFCQSLNLPTEVCATATSFFRRFFLINSIMEVHPKHILLTSIFLACKSENYFIGIEAFAKKTKSTPSTILKYEFSVLESLQFTLLNHHPYKPLHGFFLDIQHILHGKVDVSYMGQVYTNCKKRITEAILSDAVYHFTPPQIALACLLSEDEVLTLKYLEVKFGLKTEGNIPQEEVKAEDPTPKLEGDNDEPKEAPETDAKTEEDRDETENKVNEEEKTVIELTAINAEKLLQTIKECQEMLMEAATLSKEDATKIDARLHYCQNPMLLVERLRKQKQQRESSSEASEPDTKKLKV